MTSKYVSGKLLFWWSLTDRLICSVVRAYILLIYVVSEYLKRIYFRKWCHGLYPGPLGIPHSLDVLREDAMFMGVPVCVCVCMGEMCLRVHEWMTEFACVCVCVCVWWGVRHQLQGRWRMLSFFLWFSENMATVSLFQFLDLYVATKVIKCLKTITKKLHVLSLVYWLLSDLMPKYITKCISRGMKIHFQN